MKFNRKDLFALFFVAMIASTSVAETGGDASGSNLILEYDARNHWSFRHLQRPRVETSTQDAAGGNAIDYFTHRSLRKKGLQLARRMVEAGVRFVEVMVTVTVHRSPYDNH